MKSNPALAELKPLVGYWRMELYGAGFLPDPDATVTGSIDIEWIEDGAAVVMRQGDSQHPPSAVWVVGRDDSGEDYRVLYADDRGVSRVYSMSFGAGHWRMWRSTPAFSQRFEAELDPDGARISGRWEKSSDQGESWEHDFNLDYIREAPSSDRRERARRMYEAFAAGDRDFIESSLSDDFEFFSPVDVGLDRAGYFERCWPGAGRGQTFEFLRLIESGDEVIVTYEMTKADGKRGRNSEVLTFRDDQICRTEVYFGWDLP